MANATADKKAIKMPHNVIMENREKLNISGVNDVDSFDEQSVVIFTDMGELTVKGSGLQIQKFSVDTGELTVSGRVYLLSYSEDGYEKSGGFFGKLFR